MYRRLAIMMLVGLIAVTALAGCGLLQEPEEASGPIEAIPVEVAEEVGQATETETEPEAPAASEAETAVEAEPVAEPAAEEEAEAGETEAPLSSAGSLVYALDPASSRVRFVLDEDLRGVRTTVTGITDQVAGEIALDLADLSSARVGTMLINARGFMTDNNFRNRAIQNEILETGAYEFITFEPTAIEGLPASAAPGDQVQFTIVGDLTIREITLPATFTVDAVVNTPDQISGLASSIINRNDFQLTIPSVPNVANVEEEVELYIEFVANATS